jgi:hypothetical protein
LSVFKPAQKCKAREKLKPYTVAHILSAFA